MPIERKARPRYIYDFCVGLYKIQVDGGRYFLCEHLLTASSWLEPRIKSMANLDGTLITKAHMCAYGTKNLDKMGNQFVYKPTQFMPKSPHMAAQLERKCDRNHKHAVLGGNRARKAAVYPTKLIDATCNGMQDQRKADRFDLNLVASIDQ